jgi:uncharacterized OsmC-like protein
MTTESSKEDTNRVNGFDLDVLQEVIGAVMNEPELAKCRFRGHNKWANAGRNCTTISEFYALEQERIHEPDFELHADEPVLFAGGEQAANPVEHLLHALASCVTSSMVAHAAVRGIRIEELECELEGDIDVRGFLGLAENVPKGYTNIRMEFKVKTDEKDMEKLKSLAEFSPVYNSLVDGVAVDIQVEPK